MSAVVLTWVKPATDSLSEGSGKEVTRPERLVLERIAFSARTSRRVNRTAEEDRRQHDHCVRHQRTERTNHQQSSNLFWKGPNHLQELYRQCLTLKSFRLARTNRPLLPKPAPPLEKLLVGGDHLVVRRIEFDGGKVSLGPLPD